MRTRMTDDMNRKVTLVVPHCLLNQEVRAKGLTPHPEVKEKILTIANKYNVEIEQLPCPEFLFLGERKPKDFAEYEKLPGFKNFCGGLAERVCSELAKFEASSLLVIGIARSPSCSLSEVYIKGTLRKGKGLFMQELEKRLKAKWIELDYDHVDIFLREITSYLRKLSPR